MLSGGATEIKSVDKNNHPAMEGTHPLPAHCAMLLDIDAKVFQHAISVWYDVDCCSNFARTGCCFEKLQVCQSMQGTH